ncbi:hypothetical protein WJX79_006878 [Trebouxia sp. C0005]
MSRAALGLVSPGQQFVTLKCRCLRAFELYRCQVTAHRIAAVPAYATRRCQLSAASSARTKPHCARGDRVRATAAAEKNDPGHWKYSPEWWGTQAGGWGHDSGTVVFAQNSHCGNGEVTVTAHIASPLSDLDSAEQQQWRVLRFNDTRQSVSRVALQHNSHTLQASADCLAFEYLKTMASAGAAVIGLTGKLGACLSELPTLAATSPATSRFQSDPLEQRLDKGRGLPQGLGACDTRHHTSCRALCIGLGGGSLPNFLSHHFPGLVVDAVELDPTVVTAATQCMGLPYSRSNLRLHTADAADYVLNLASQVHKGLAEPLDIVFIDAFDGNDDIPDCFCDPDSEVLEALATALHPVHGSIIMNVHGGGLPTSSALLALFFGWLPFSSKQESSGYHHSTDEGQAVLQIASTLRDKLLAGPHHQQRGTHTHFKGRACHYIMFATNGGGCLACHHGYIVSSPGWG